MRRSATIARSGVLLLAVMALTADAARAQAPVRTTRTTYPSGDRAVAVECFAPKNGTEALPVVVVLHGSGGLDGATGAMFREVATTLARRGYVVVLPHLFTRIDHRVGDVFTASDDEAMLEATADAIRFAGTLPRADGDRVGLVGFSMGSSLAMIVAREERKVRAIASWSGSYLPGDPIDPDGPAMLILHGGRDTLAGPDQARARDKALADRGIAHDLHIYPSSGHNFDATRFRDAAGRTAAFFAKHLKAATASDPPAD